MTSIFGQQAPKASWALFEALFIIAALVAVFATFIAIADVDPDAPTSGAIPWFLGFNTLLIVVLTTLVGREYLAMQRRSRGEGKGRLARRFVLLFGFSALLPAMVVAIFLGAVITQGIDRWLGERVETLMEKNTQIFQDYQENFQRTFELDTRAAAIDVENFARAVDSSSNGTASDATGSDAIAQAFSDGLRDTLAYRGFLTVAILGPDGIELIAEESVQTPVLIQPPASVITEAQSGTIGTTLYQNSGIATSVVQIDAPLEGYLYAAKSFDQNLFGMLTEAREQLAQYNNAKRQSGRLQMIFAIGYAQVTALVLLLAGRLGLEAAGRITGPIGRLAFAAHTVRDGDLSVRVPVAGPEDEVYALSQSFNAMTEQLSEQRGALIRAREDAENRRQFVETLLAEVSAGVIRTDANLVVTLANRSAGELLGCRGIESGVDLRDIASDFEPLARKTLELSAAFDSSLDLTINSEIRHIRLKTAPDPAGGCVLTFDDTTRLVNAQRQLAWRDVARRIAHEIRNPLTPIQLSTERLKRRYGNVVNDEDGVFDRCIETILRQVNDIGRMVEEFSNFARMPKPSVAPFDMRALLEKVSFSQSVVSPEVQVEFETNLYDAQYMGDDRLLGQAFGNLVKNAAEAIAGMPEDAEVSGQIRIVLSEADNGLEIFVEDNGPGFPDETRERLLEPYVTNRQGGTGLGLAIVNRIVADHGGSVSLQNRIDGLRGARVRVWLPYNNAQFTERTHSDESNEELETSSSVAAERVEETPSWH